MISEHNCAKCVCTICNNLRGKEGHVTCQLTTCQNSICNVKKAEDCRYFTSLPIKQFNIFFKVKNVLKKICEWINKNLLEKILKK